jgi:hypothetical protein
MDIGLPRGFGIEIGAMYRHFDQKSITITTTGIVSSPDGEDTYPIQQTANISAVGHSWEVPVAVQYHLFSKSAVRPYVEGGVSLNHLSNVFDFQNANVLTPFPRTLPFTIGPTHSSFDRVGGLFGLGVDLNLHVIHVTPGFRYTHYNDTRQWLPATNSVDFLVGFTF